jgi:hypothetical protein
MKRPLNDARQISSAIDTIDALAERTIDLRLVRVLVEVELLVRVPAVIMRRDVTRNHDHRDGVERRVGHARRGVRQAGSEMREEHTRLA